MQLSPFDEVAEYVRALLPSEYDDVRIRSHRRGVKIWFGPEKAAKEHYEAQLLARRHVDGKPGTAVEPSTTSRPSNHCAVEATGSRGTRARGACHRQEVGCLELSLIHI